MNGATTVFEWNERKRRSNLRKHGLDFADCAKVFAGPIVTSTDDRHDYGEIRYQTFGLLQCRVVSIIHTELEDWPIRIISLRKANKYEQARYLKAFQD